MRGGGEAGGGEAGCLEVQVFPNNAVRFNFLKICVVF